MSPLTLTVEAPSHSYPIFIDVSLQAASAALQQRFQLQNQEVYLVRPDQHVCGRWLQYRDQAISATLNPLLTAAVTA